MFPDEPKLATWANKPTVEQLTHDKTMASAGHEEQLAKVRKWRDVLEGNQKIEKIEGQDRSTVVPKLARKLGEWRYPVLSEPFLSSADMFDTMPVSFEDRQRSIQHGQILNYQFNHRIDKVRFINELVRKAVNEGTVIVRTSWDRLERMKDVEVTEEIENPVLDVVTGQPVIDPQTNQPVMGEPTIHRYTRRELVAERNQPKLTVCNIEDVLVDPSCEGRIENARFVIHRSLSSLAELKASKLYTNLDRVDWDSAAEESIGSPVTKESSQNFEDKARKRVEVHEYWGFWDIHGNGQVVPIVATWVGKQMIRLEESPFPDGQLPFVIIQYLVREGQIYGDADCALIADNQAIVGSITRGIVDLLGNAALGQQISRNGAVKGADLVRQAKGQSYSIQTTGNEPLSHHIMSVTYPDVPNGALNVLQMQAAEAESMAGIKAFAEGISGQSLGNTATGINSAINATATRELDILRRIGQGLIQIGRKIMAMNAVFLDDGDVMRITNNEFITVNKDDLSALYDVRLNISTLESDENKAQQLSTMLQTMGNNLPLEMTNLILAQIARLRKMPDVAHAIENYRPEPDPLEQRKRELEIALLEAQVINEKAKGQENMVDVDLKSAKAAKERAAAENLGARTDESNLNFLERSEGVPNAQAQEDRDARFRQDVARDQSKMLSEQDKAVLGQMLKNFGTQGRGLRQ